MSTFDYGAQAVVDFVMPWGNYLLKELVETPAPEPVSWLPQTYGWWLLLLAVCAYLGYRLYCLYRLYLANAYRRDGLAYLEVIVSDQRWSQVPILLKKVAIDGYGRSLVASLSGKQWEQWLDSVCPMSRYRQDCPGLLAKIAYQSQVELTDIEAEILYQQTRIWIRSHRASEQLTLQEASHD